MVHRMSHSLKQPLALFSQAERIKFKQQTWTGPKILYSGPADARSTYTLSAETPDYQISL